MPNGQPTSSWSATAFSPVFGESAARLPARLPYRTIFLLPTATEDALAAAHAQHRVTSVKNVCGRTGKPAPQPLLLSGIIRTGRLATEALRE
jgi:hypothetical protein